MLLVDGSKVVRDRLADALRERLPAPLQVLEAATSEGAMVLLRSGAPEVMLLDLQLAKGSGFDVLDAMQAEGLPRHGTPNPDRRR